MLITTYICVGSDISMEALKCICKSICIFAFEYTKLWAWKDGCICQASETIAAYSNHLLYSRGLDVTLASVCHTHSTQWGCAQQSLCQHWRLIPSHCQWSLDFKYSVMLALLAKLHSQLKSHDILVLLFVYQLRKYVIAFLIWPFYMFIIASLVREMA